MSYATITIGDLLADVNSRYFLPAIQRPYVWNGDQVITLIDSLLKGYPISSLMFWSVDEELKRELKIYNFIEHWKPGMQNPVASVNGRDVTLVLDGQQRITSLLIALRGSFAEKAKHKRRASPDAWSEKTLYLDLLADPDAELEEEDVEFGVSYGLRFHAVAPRNDHRHQWFRVGDMLIHDMGDGVVDIGGAWIIAASSQKMADGMQADLRGKSWLLDDEIPSCANECRRHCTRLRSTIERDVEILRGLGSGKPLA
ncbi:MAG: DUF262 domain-containing protein, partial [Rhodobacterales bacterium]